MKMHRLGGREDGKQQYGDHYRPFNGQCSLELAFPFHTP